MTKNETLDAVIIGAGFSGICAGIKLQEQGINSYKIYDKAPKVGGTWYHNTYP
ncbi:MAG: cation diffusion facilitator CzcD-associated flavoprotein CzcO, partial [Bermanella sp.]